MSPYYDLESLVSTYRNSDIPIIISINIRSLSCNHANLLAVIQELELNNVIIYAIIIQETWNVRYSDLISIPGFQKLFLKLRVFSNGGGLGIYVRDGITCKQIDIENAFIEKIFESLTIELTINKRKILISNIYRSPSGIPNLTANDQINSFMNKLDEHLSFLNSQNTISYVFLDSNIDVSKINVHQTANEYSDIILSNGFIQTITKATRVQGPSHSIIDHILTNDISTHPYTGIIISDVSDHFFTFIELNKRPTNTVINR